MLKKIAKKIKLIIKKILAKIQLKKVLVKIDGKRIIYIGSPLHGNMGDHAISIAIRNLLNIYNLPVVEIPGELFDLSSKSVCRYVCDNDIIIITGGGLIGSLWMNEEEIVKKIIGSFKNNKIIIMPQTYYFEDNINGKNELENLKEVINSHKHVYLCAREKTSYNLCKRHFKNARGIYLLPDVVLTMNYLKREKRENILLIMRNDKEKWVDYNNIIHKTFRNNECIKTSTTVINENISLGKRKKILFSKLDEFSRAKLVVTDRLHGMIFAAITGTPCIAFDNKSKKVSGVYEWLKSLQYIRYCNNVNDIQKIVFNMNLSKEYSYNLHEKFIKQIDGVIGNIINK